MVDVHDLNEGDLNQEDLSSRERIPVDVVSSADEGARRVAAEVAVLIRERQMANAQVVLGLATGSSPVRFYRELIRLHREEGLSFANVVTFNLDEYYPLAADHAESYRRFMQEQLFDHIDIPPENIHIPDGSVSREKAHAHAREYEERIREAGGIDFQILGIGRTGHIGFNEPGSDAHSRTRLVPLNALTRQDAARDFLGLEKVPPYGITMGVGTILEAREVVLFAWGQAKAKVIAQAVEGPVDPALPASFLQHHGEAWMVLDEAAAGELSRYRFPWLVKLMDWQPRLIRQAVSWLSEETGKSVLRLVESDYADHGLADLLAQAGPAYGLNIRIFNELQHTISGWPGGKPRADDSTRPERASPHPKRVLVLAPEPLDDVFGLGGTLSRLVRQGHEVTVAYMTSGSLGVPEEDAEGAQELLLEAAREGILEAPSQERSLSPDKAPPASPSEASGKAPSEAISKEQKANQWRRLKALMRRREARSATALCGLSADSLRFLDLPFYETGRYRSFHPGGADARAVQSLLEDLQPHQVFATGQGEDPTSLAAVCYGVFAQAWEATQDAAWRAESRLWLYRAHSEDWPVHAVDMAVPLSPDELRAKVSAVYCHLSQRNQLPGTGEAGDEAWYRAVRRNRAAAGVYHRLGLAEYEAMEFFRRGD